MTVVLAKRSDKPHARPRGRLHPTDNGDGADAGRSSMAPGRVPVPLRATRQGTQHSGTKLLPLTTAAPDREPIHAEMPTPFY